jgi:alternate signal-mediated exported protein
MQKSLKGALAAGVGGVLLLGGAGTLAYWTGAVSVPGQTGINSGKLSLTDTTVGGCPAVGWLLDTAVAGGGAFNPVTATIVPGDVLTKTCTYLVGAAGTHLHATLVPTAPGATGDLSSALTVGGTFMDGVTTVTDITEAMDGHTVTAKITVTFLPASGNATQVKVADISDYSIAITQAHT